MHKKPTKKDFAYKGEYKFLKGDYGKELGTRILLPTVHPKELKSTNFNIQEIRSNIKQAIQTIAYYNIL